MSLSSKPTAAEITDELKRLAKTNADISLIANLLMRPIVRLAEIQHRKDATTLALTALRGVFFIDLGRHILQEHKDELDKCPELFICLTTRLLEANRAGQKATEQLLNYLAHLPTVPEPDTTMKGKSNAS